MGPEPPDAPLVDWRVGWVVALTLLIGGTILVGRHLHWGHGTDEPLRAVVDALHAGDDEAAYAAMSQRYRTAHTLSEFRRSVAAMSELRSAEGVTLDRPALAAWQSPRSPDHLCGLLQGVNPPTFVAATVVEEGRRFALDALSVEGRQLDPESAAEPRRCQPTRGVWR